MATATMRIAGDDGRALAKRVNFALETVRAATCPVGKGRTWVYDSKSPLGLMVTEGGARSFYSYRKVNGRPQRVRLGAFPELTVEQARKMTHATVGDSARPALRPAAFPALLGVRVDSCRFDRIASTRNSAPLAILGSTWT